ncbi:WD repeat-containing protein 75 [Bienertia sinuspersici]
MLIHSSCLGDAAISAIAFRPGWEMVVSSSYGGDFKVLYVFGLKAILLKVKVECMDAQAGSAILIPFILVISYCRKKSMTAATFSADGSILAVAAETVITLWNPDRNYLVGVVGETYMVINISFCLTSLVYLDDLLVLLSKN